MTKITLSRTHDMYNEPDYNQIANNFHMEFANQKQQIYRSMYQRTEH